MCNMIIPSNHTGSFLADMSTIFGFGRILERTEVELLVKEPDLGQRPYLKPLLSVEYRVIVRQL